MQFSAVRLRVITVVHRLNDGDNPADEITSQVTATSDIGGAGQMDLHLDIAGGSDLRPGDYIEIDGRRLPR